MVGRRGISATAGGEDERKRALAQAPAWMGWRLERDQARLRDFTRVLEVPDLDVLLNRLREVSEEAEVELMVQLRARSWRFVDQTAEVGAERGH